MNSPPTANDHKEIMRTRNLSISHKGSVFSSGTNFKSQNSLNFENFKKNNLQPLEYAKQTSPKHEEFNNVP